MKLLKTTLTLALTCFVAAAGFSQDRKQGVETPVKRPLSTEALGTIEKDILGMALAQYGVVPKNGVSLYRLTYETTNLDGSPLTASGVVMIPVSEVKQKSFPWIALQHGTIAAKADAPSLKPFEGLVEASQGFVTVIADYIGYGSSADTFHPYVIEAGYQTSIIDMLRIAKTFVQTDHGVTLGKFFLKGYSEGGYATLALQKALETSHAEEFSIAASAPSAGPYDVELTGLMNVQEGTVSPVNIPYVLLSYNYYLADRSLPLDAIFNVPVATVENALSGTYTIAEIFNMLPSTTTELFQSAFVDDFLLALPEQEPTQKLRALLRSQSLLQYWTPKTKTAFFHCEDDEQIPVDITEIAVAKFQARGATDVAAVIIPSMDPENPYKHSNCPAIFSPVKWFEQVLAAP